MREGYGTWSVSVCPDPAGTTSPATTRNGASNRRYIPTASAQSGKHFKYGVFSKNALFKSQQANKYVLTAMAPMERHFARNFEDRAFSGSFKV